MKKFAFLLALVAVSALTAPAWAADVEVTSNLVIWTNGNNYIAKANYTMPRLSFELCPLFAGRYL